MKSIGRFLFLSFVFISMISSRGFTMEELDLEETEALNRFTNYFNVSSI